MSTEDNVRIVQRLYEEVINAGNLDLADEVVAADIIEHEQFPGMSPGREGFKQFFAMFRAAFPDLRFTVRDVIAQEDRVVARVTLSGTHQGEFMEMEPTGKRFEVEAIDIGRIADGKIVEHWGQTDTMGMMAQLGAGPPG